MVVPKRSQRRPMTPFAGKLAISSIFHRFVACLAAPLVLWVPESLRAHGDGCQRMGTDAARSDAPIEEIGDIDAWRPKAILSTCPTSKQSPLKHFDYILVFVLLCSFLDAVIPASVHIYTFPNALHVPVSTIICLVCHK